MVWEWDFVLPRLVQLWTDCEANSIPGLCGGGGCFSFGCSWVREGSDSVTLAQADLELTESRLALNYGPLASAC